MANEGTAREQLRLELIEMRDSLSHYDAYAWVDFMLYGLRDTWQRMSEIGDDFPARPSVPVFSKAFLAATLDDRRDLHSILSEFNVDHTDVLNAMNAAVRWCGQDGTEGYLTIGEASYVSGTNPGVIRRAIDTGKLKSNGQSGRSRRVDTVDLVRWRLERSKRYPRKPF